VLSSSAHRLSSAFLLLWLGQLVSSAGSGLTSFSLAYWVYQRHHSTTQLSLMLLASALPAIFISPLAGALVDRWDRRMTMILSSLTSAVFTFVMFALLQRDKLSVWEVAIVVGGISVAGAFQWPAYSAANTMLLRGDQLGRAGGFMQLTQAISFITSPALASVLIPVIHLQGIVIIDFLTYVVMIMVLLRLRIPSPTVSSASKAFRGTLCHEAASGWGYIRSLSGFTALMMSFVVVMFCANLVEVLILPLLLQFGSVQALAVMVTLSSSGMLVGSILLMIWGGPERKISGIRISGVLLSIALLSLGLSPSRAIVTISLFLFMVIIPFAAGMNQTVLQAGVEPDMQGRVFAVRRIISQASLPLAASAAAFTVEPVFRPLLSSPGIIGSFLREMMGRSPSGAVGMCIALAGVIALLVNTYLYFLPSLRSLERLMDNAEVSVFPLTVGQPAVCQVETNHE